MSTVEVEVLGSGRFSGSVANIVDYDVTEYGSPLSMTDLQGGVGNVSFTVNEDPSFNGSVLLSGQPIELRDPYSGRQRAVVDDSTVVDDGQLQVSASGMLLPLVSQREAAPFSGTLGGAIIYYCGLCGIDSGFQFDPDISTKAVSLPRWKGDVWNQLKKLMAIHQFEMADVAGKIVIRKLRLRTVDTLSATETRLRYGRGDSSQIIEVHYYNNTPASNLQVHPDPESSITERSIISVNAGEVSVDNVKVNMWVDTIDDPTHVLTLPWNNTSTTSVYSVVDKDGVAVSPGDWANGGGEVSFAVGADGKSIDVTVRGMSTQSRAPYRIAASSQDQEYQYAALYIAASGVAFKDEMLWSHTGADLVDAPSDSVTTIDDPMVSTRAEAAAVLANAVFDNCGFTQEIELSAQRVNRRGETGLQLYPTFSEWDAANPILTFGQFDIAQAGKTFGQYDDILAAEYEDDFDSQAFGGIGGARTRFRDNMYRIRQASASPAGFGWTAHSDMLFSDWDASFPVLTFGDFDAMWAGKTFEQHARMPLMGDGTYVEVSRNLVATPRPTAFSGSGWAAAIQSIPEPGWVGFTLSSTTTPYIFTGRSDRAYAAGEQVTLSVRYRVHATDSLPRWVTTMPHVRTGNSYYRGGYQVVRPVVVGQDEDVVIQWITPVAIAAGAGLDIAIVASDSAGTTTFTAAAGFGFRATCAQIEDGWTDGAFFDGSTPNDYPTSRTRWLGGVNASTSVKENLIPRVG